MGPPFVTLALDGDERSASRPGRFTPGEEAPSVAIGYEVGRAQIPV
jgi:hypothetical protein